MRSLQHIFQIGARAVGIDIGARAIKVAEVRRTTKGIELSRYGVAATPEAAVQNGMILDPPAAAAVIVAVLREAGIRTRRVIASVSGQHVLARILRLPPIPEDEVKQAVRWEAERHLPFPVEEAVLDTQVVGERSEDGQRRIEVLLAAAPERLVLTYIQTLEAAGLSADALEVSAVAMVRALTASATRGIVAMVNLGASTTEVAIVREAVPLLTRTIPEGVEGTPLLATLALQLRRSFDFYRAQDETGHVDRIILCGGGARFPEIDRRLAQEMDVPVTIGALPEALLISTRLDAATTSDVAPQLMTAVGLALRTLM